MCYEGSWGGQFARIRRLGGAGAIAPTAPLWIRLCGVYALTGSHQRRYSKLLAQRRLLCASEVEHFS